MCRFAIAALLLLLAAPLRAQDALVTYKSLNPDVALDLARAALSSCRERGFQVAVAVVDRFGVTQVLSPTALVSSTLLWSRGKGWYNDPYKLTLTFFPSGSPVVAADVRPDHRNTVVWLTRFRSHHPASGGTLQADYRYFSDDWGIRAHTLEVAWAQALQAERLRAT